MAATAMQAEELRTAFEAFNQQSTLLEASYRQLQDKVLCMNVFRCQCSMDIKLEGPSIL